MTHQLTLSEYQDRLSSITGQLRDDEVVPAMRYLCRTDLYFLLRHACKRKDMEDEWLFQRCREVQKDPNGFLDLWARGHYKSTIITFGRTIQDILASHGEDALPEWGGREVTIGLFSHNRPMAKDFLRQIKQEFEENPRLKLWFPDVLYENPKGESLKWNEDSGLTVKRKSNPKEATVEAAGVVEGQPTGKHYVIRVYDDMVHEKYVTNPDIIERTTRMWANSLNLGDKDFNIERYIGTRYHLKDTYAEMIKRGAVKTRLHAATENGQPDGKPVFFSREQLAAVRKNSGAHVFACQQLLDPLAEGISSFKESDLRYYEYRSGIEKGMNVYIVVDPASSKKKGSDYTVFWVIGLASDQNYYVLDVVRDRLNLRERGETLMRLHRRWHPLGVGYEKYGMQCDKEHIEYVQEEKTYRFNIEELGGSMSKKDRIRKLQPLFENNRIWLPEQVMYRNYEKKMVDLIDDFKTEEYISFPVGGHDDMLDSMARILDEDLMATFPLTDEEMDVGRGRATASSDRYNRRPRKSATAWAH